MNDDIHEGILQPSGQQLSRWRFLSLCIHLVQQVRSFHSDLDVNLAGSALVLELLEEIERLRPRLAGLENRAEC